MRYQHQLTAFCDYPITYTQDDVMAEIKAAAAAEEATRKQVSLLFHNVPTVPYPSVPLAMSVVIHSICSGKKRQLQQPKKPRRRRRASR